MGENCIYKNKRIVIWVGLFLCLLFGAFINTGKPSKAVDLNYEDFALLKIDGSKTTLEVENSKNFDSNTAPSYAVNNFKYIEDNKLVFVMKFNFSCQGVAKDLNDNTLINLFGQNWQAVIFDTLVNEYNLKIDYADGGYKASQETFGIINGYTETDWQTIIVKSFPKKADSVDKRIRDTVMANMKATFHLMVEQNKYIKLTDLPSSEERLIYYCASSADNQTITYENGVYSFTDYDQLATSMNDSTGFIASYLHLFSSYNLVIKATHNGNFRVDINNDGVLDISNDAYFTSFIFPAYYDLAAINADGASFDSLDSKYLVDAGERTQALFCNNWMEGQLRLEQGDQRYYGYCDGGYTFIKNQGETTWELRREIDLSSSITGHDLIWNEAKQEYDLHNYTYKFADGPHELSLNFAMEQEIVNFGFAFSEGDSLGDPVELSELDTILQSFKADRNANFENFSTVVTSYFLDTLIGKLNYISIQGGSEENYLEYLDNVHNLLMTADKASRSFSNWIESIAGSILNGIVDAGKAVAKFFTDQFNTLLGIETQPEEIDPVAEKLKEVNYLLGIQTDSDPDFSTRFSGAPQRINAVFTVIYEYFFAAVEDQCVNQGSIEGCLMTYDEFKTFTRGAASDFISVWNNSELLKNYPNNPKFNAFCKMLFMIGVAGQGIGVIGTAASPLGGILGATIGSGLFSTVFPTVGTLVTALAAVLKVGELYNYTLKMIINEIFGEWTDIFEAAIEIFNLAINDPSALDMLAGPVYQVYVETMLFGYDTEEYHNKEFADLGGSTLLAGAGGKTGGFFAKVGANFEILFDFLGSGIDAGKDALMQINVESMSDILENANYKQCMINNGYFDAGKIADWTVLAIVTNIVFYAGAAVLPLLATGVTLAVYKLLFNECTAHLFMKMLDAGAIFFSSAFEALKKSWEQKKNNSDAPDSYDYLMSAYQTASIYSYFYDWVVEPYGQYYNADTGQMAPRRHVELYNYFIMALKSKFVNAAHTTTSKSINIIIDRTSPDQVVIDDAVSSNVNQEILYVAQKDTQNYQIIYKEVSVVAGETDVSNLYIFKGGQYVATVGKAVNNVKYYQCIRMNSDQQRAQLVHVAVGASVQGYYIFNEDLNMYIPASGMAVSGQDYYTYVDEPLGGVEKIGTAYQQDKLISNQKYTFGVYGSHYGDANIKFNKSAADRWIVGSGIDHFDYVIFKNIGKLGELNDLELYGNVKYEKVSVTPNVTNLDLEELYTLENGVYTLAKGTAVDGVSYYKKVDLEKLWKVFSGFSTDMKSIIGSLTSVDNNLVYEQLWSQLPVNETFTIEEDGQYIILVRAVDFVGNRGAVTVKEVLIDTSAPELLLDFANGDTPIVATNEQYQDIANAIKNGEETTYDFVISDESISKMNISLVEETTESSYASGLLVNDGKLTSFKMCIADILNGGAENCLNLNKQFYGYGVSQKGYISATSLDNQATLETEWETGIHSSSSVRGVYKPSFGQYVMMVDFGEDIATIYRVAFEISDVAGNVTLVRILVVSNIGNIEIESDISTKAEYDLTNPDNKIKDFDVTLLYSRFTIGDLTYTGENLSNEVDGNYLDLNDTKIMTYRYFVIGKSDRDKFYKLRDSAACDLDDNPNNPACGRDNDELSDRFLQVEPSNQLENLITSLTNLNEDHFIFQQFELKLGGTKKEYTYVIMQEFEYSLEDLMKQLSFTVNEYGHEVGSIVTDPTFELLSSEKFEFRLKFIDYSKYDKTGNADYGCIDEEKNVCYNLINKLKYTFDLYRLGISNPESSKHEIAMELDTYTDFVDFDEQSFDQTAFTTNSKRIVYKQNSNDEVDYIEYYIYINLLDYAEELKYSPTFSINNFVFVSTKNMKREHYDNNNQLIENLTSTYLLLNEEDTGFTIYSNYLEDNDDGNSKIDQLPNLGSFEFDPSMDVKEYDDNGKVTRWTNQSTLIFLLSDGSASFDYIFDPTLIYQYTVFPNNISEDYATALIADHYNIDLLNVLLVCQKPGDSLCTSAVTNQRLALINKYLETISRPDFNKLNRYLNNNNLSLVNVDMKILKELDIYTIEYQKIVAEYMYNLNDTVGIYNYLVNSSIEQTPLDRLKNSISSAVTTVEFWPTTYRIYSNMLGWNTVEFDTENKTTGVINASQFITDTNNKSYIILYRVIDVLGRSSMDYKEITYFQTVPTITVTGEQIMDLADPIFSSSLSKNTLDQYLLDNRLIEYFDGNEEYFQLVNKNTIKYCIMINGECVEPNNDVIKENIFVGNTYQVVFSMDDYAGNTLSIPVSYKVIYSRKPTINISTIDGYAKEKTLDVNVVYTSIGGVDVKTIEMSYCSEACQLSSGDIDLVNNTYKGKRLQDLTQEELITLYELMLSVSGKIELTMSNDSRNASTTSPVKLNGWYLARVITTNAPKNSVPPYAELTETVYSPVFVLDKTDNKAPVVLLGDENRVNDNSHSTLLPNGVDGTTEDYYFNNSNVFLFVKDNEVGISGATVKLVKKVAKDCVFIPAEEEDFQCFNTEIEAGLAIESTLLDGNVWKFDLSPNRNRIGKTTYYLRASDDLGNVVYRRIDIQVDTQAPEIDSVRTKVNNDSISNNLYVESPEIVIDFAANANLSSGFEVASPLHRVVIYEPGKNEDNPTIRLCSEYNNCNGVSKLKYNLAMEIDSSGNRFYRNGMKEVVVELYDAAGNVSAAHKFNVLLDTDAPKISVELSSDSVINNVGQIVKINAVDSTSTIFDGEFSEDDVTHYGLAYRKDGSNIWVKINDMSVLLTENGKYTFRAYDFALNYSEATIEIHNIDKEAPMVQFSVDGSSNALPSHTVSIQLEDKLSNIKVIKYCWIKYGEIDCVEYEYTNNLITNNTKVFEVTANKSVSKVIENGEYILSVYVEDIWGNNNVYQTRPFSFDCKKPNIIPNITLDYKKCAFDSTSDCFNPETEMYEFLIELTDSKNILDLQLSETAKVYISGFTTTEISGVYVNLVDGEFTTLNANKINYYDAVAGTYYLRYSVEYKDVNDNNQVESAIVKIVIKDAQAPIITIRGESSMTYTVGTLSSYEDEGVGIVDVHDGNIAFKETWRKYYFSELNNPFSEAMQEVPQINPNLVGTYYVLYEAYDLTGNKQTALRTVKFVDDVAPVITFDSGDDLDNYLVGNDFDYLKGITIKDNYDGVIVEDYVNESSEVSKDFSKLIISYYIYSEDAKAFIPQNTLQFTKIVGIHKYTYRFKDKHEQEATLDRYIRVKDVVATMVVEGNTTTFDLSNNKEGIVDGAISIDPNGLNLKINGVAYAETTVLNQVGKHSIMISDNYNNSVEYSIYMDTSTPGDTKTVLVDKTKVTVEQTIIKTIDANTTALDLTADLAEGGSLSRYIDNPDYVIVVAIFCDDLNNTNGVACSDNYLELSVLENITNGNSVVSMSNVSTKITFDDDDVKKILEQTNGGKVALLVMSAEESATIAQAFVPEEKNTSSKISLVLIIGIPSLLGLYVLIRIFKFKKSIKTM